MTHKRNAKPAGGEADSVYSDGDISSVSVSEGETAAFVDDAATDPTLIGWMLDRSPEERLEALQGFVDSVWELRGGRKA